jgi:hypothetical protein
LANISNKFSRKGLLEGREANSSIALFWVVPFPNTINHIDG